MVVNLLLLLELKPLRKVRSLVRSSSSQPISTKKPQSSGELDEEAWSVSWGVELRMLCSKDWRRSIVIFVSTDPFAEDRLDHWFQLAALPRRIPPRLGLLLVSMVSLGCIMAGILWLGEDVRIFSFEILKVKVKATALDWWIYDTVFWRVDAHQIHADGWTQRIATFWGTFVLHVSQFWLIHREQMKTLELQWRWGKFLL